MGTPAGYDYRAVSDLGNYSKLRMRWWFTEFGVRQSIGQNLLFEYAITYNDFTDAQPYLVNTAGTHWGGQFRINWLF